MFHCIWGVRRWGSRCMIHLSARTYTHARTHTHTYTERERDIYIYIIYMHIYSFVNLYFYTHTKNVDTHIFKLACMHARKSFWLNLHTYPAFVSGLWVTSFAACFNLLRSASRAFGEGGRNHTLTRGEALNQRPALHPEPVYSTSTSYP